VGGCVRDEILGVPSKDIDFTVVMEESDLRNTGTEDELDMFKVMVRRLNDQGFKIFLETPEYLTVRAQFPDRYFTTPPPGKSVVPVLQREKGITADFVLARKESDYTDGRRPDTVVPGTLEDDLARRDFTMNAIAKASDGSYIDPFNGRDDIRDAVIRAVGDPMERLTEDALRALRALRFSVTKKIKWPCYWKSFEIEESLAEAMESEEVIDSILDNISDERIQVELSKMFRYDTRGSLDALEQFPYLRDAVFSGSVSLDATMKLKGRGK
jgi:tRNA nucleotidyltransferase/poly(A) polymerase